MIYKCAKCNFFFERKSEPPKCPNCDSQHVVGANEAEQQKYKKQHGKRKNVIRNAGTTGNAGTAGSNDTQ